MTPSLLTPFRFSLYLTMVMAVLGLGYASIGYLPEVPLIAGLSLLLLGVSFFLEGRWFLTLQASNTVGLALGGVVILWVGFQFVRSSPGLADQLPFPARLLPYLGPIVMLLLPAKLLRTKEIGDYWTLYFLSLVGLGLGGTMVYDGPFLILMGLYLLVMIWSLSLFYLCRESGELDKVASGEWRVASEDKEGVQSLATPSLSSFATRHSLLATTGSGWWLGIAGRGAVPALVIGVALLFLTPRPPESQWEVPLGKSREEVGLSDDVDLNRTGNLTLNKEVAYEVKAEDADGRPKLDLFPGQRWRALTYPVYRNGRWSRDGRDAFVLVQQVSRPPLAMGIDQLKANGGHWDSEVLSTFPKQRLPDLGPEKFYLTYVVKSARANQHHNILADPVMWKAGEPPPVATLYFRGPRQPSPKMMGCSA